MTYSLISGFQGGSDAQKKRYQVFEIELGFEKVKVLIPLKEADDFEADVEAKQPKTITRLKTIVEQFDGIIE